MQSVSAVAIGAIILLSALSTAAKAQEVLDGWSVEFKQDTFEKTVFPYAVMPQSGESIDKAELFVACSDSSALIALLKPGLLSFASTAKVLLRDGDATHEFTFASTNVPHLGKRLAISAGDTVELIRIFKEAMGRPVAFRSGDKQGEFNSIAATKAFELVGQNCPGTKS